MGRVGRVHALPPPPGCGRPPPVLTGRVRAFHAFHTRRRHSGVACGKGGKGVRAPIHLPHQAHRTRRARGRAFHASHRTPPPFPPHSGPQTRGTTPPRRRQAAEKTKNGRKPGGFAASPHHRRPLSYPPCILMESPPGELAGVPNLRAAVPAGRPALHAVPALSLRWQRAFPAPAGRDAGVNSGAPRLKSPVTHRGSSRRVLHGHG